MTQKRKKSTHDLFEDAKKGIQPSKEHQIPTLDIYLSQLLEKYQLKWTDIEGIVNISKSQLYTFTDVKNPSTPSRDQLIAIMFAIGASFDETQNALIYAAHRSLYPKDARDSVFIYHLCKENRYKGITLINDALVEKGFDTIPKPFSQK